MNKQTPVRDSNDKRLERTIYSVSLGTFRWAIGLLATLTVALFAIPIYKIFDTDATLHHMDSQYARMAEQMISLDVKMDLIIAAHNQRIDNIQAELDKRTDSIEHELDRRHETLDEMRRKLEKYNE